MSLTSTEEALVRQLLDQQAAILSLAGNEATITSKLGATKVTLSDLVAASSIADADIMLTRQGANDKSVRADILAAYMGAELGALFAPIANPTFTGDPKAPTAAKFDNDTSLATTAFVQRALGNLRAETAVNSSTTLDTAAIGQLIVGGAGVYTTTLPLASTCPPGSQITFFGTTGISTWLVQRQGTDIIDNNGGGTFFSIGGGDSAVLESNGTGTWRIVGGSLALRYAASFGASLTNPGWRKLPTGEIEQWATQTPAAVGNFNTQSIGGTTFYTSYYNITYPIAFTSSVYEAECTIACSSYWAQSGMAGNAASLNLGGTGNALTGMTVAITTPTLGYVPTIHWRSRGK